MFPKNQRISKKKEVQAVFDRKLSFYNKFFGLKAKVNDSDENRYTVLVSKKVAKLAVDRNKIKRRIKYVLRQNDQNERKYHYDLIVVSLKNASELDFTELKKYLEELLNRLK